jgi:hypothetical protein
VDLPCQDGSPAINNRVEKRKRQNAIVRCMLVFPSGKSWQGV